MSLSIRYTDLQARRIAGGLVAIELLFAVTYVVIHIVAPDLSWGVFRGLFDLDDERSLTTWFSVIQLFVIGAVLLLAAANNRRQQDLSNFALIAAGLLFIWLSADEGSQLHERLTYMARHFGLSELSFVGEYGAWIVAYAVLGSIAVALGIRHIGAVWRHFRPVAVTGFGGFTMFLVGAVGFEMASFPFRESDETLTQVAVTIEEFLEMAGASVVLYASLILASRVSTVGV